MAKVGVSMWGALRFVYMCCSGLSPLPLRMLSKSCTFLRGLPAVVRLTLYTAILLSCFLFPKKNKCKVLTFDLAVRNPVTPAFLIGSECPPRCLVIVGTGPLFLRSCLLPKTMARRGQRPPAQQNSVNIAVNQRQRTGRAPCSRVVSYM